MYGPNGFRETEQEARTFQNVLTSAYAGAEHPLDDEANNNHQFISLQIQYNHDDPFRSGRARSSHCLLTGTLLLCRAVNV